MKFLSIFMVGVALLVGGCEEKDTEEKPLLIVSPEDLTEVGGITYFPQKDGTSKPYTGWSVLKHVGLKLREVYYKNGKKHGTEIEYSKYGSNRKMVVTPWVNGKKHGMEIVYHAGGSKKSETSYVNGKKHGMEIVYHEDGSKESETSYVNGKKHGMEIVYHEDGLKFVETPWVNGKEHGMENIYTPGGSKWFETVFENGKIID